MTLYYYDLETYFDCFLFSGKFEGAPEIQTFEISWRKNQRTELLQWINYLQNANATLIGFNNLHFDYPIIHELIQNPYTFTYETAYLEAQKIIQQGSYGQNPNHIRFTDRYLPQVDLVKINHFDNNNRRTSLKALQFAMQSASVEDLPFDFRQHITSEQIDLLIAYNHHDVTETEKFGNKCKHLIQMRLELLEQGVLSGDVLNYSDVKIGTEYLIRKIGRQKCFISGSKPRQSFRDRIDFKNIILPKISYRTEAFSGVRAWFENQTIFPGAKREPPKLQVRLANLDFHFGVGGVHASVENKRYESNETHVIKDIDVAGMYVAVAIANGFAPEHLGKDFSLAYRQLQADRAQYKKGTTMNAVLKLAGNGVYGNSNNPYSCFYDPKYTFSVTVNGQLQLLQLAEILSLIPGLEIIQANTDGITAFVPRQVAAYFDLWCRDWEIQTGLKLEEVEYSHMWIRDVNNYLARTTAGKLKRKGAYAFPETDKDYEGYWNKDYSMMVVQKAICEVLVHGYQPAHIVPCFTDKFDFMLRYKTPAGAKTFIGDKEMLKTVRYYVSTKGQPMKKVSTPTGPIGQYKRKNGITDELYAAVLKEIGPGVWDERIHNKKKSKYEMTTTSVESGWLVKECNKASDFDWNDVDYSYYIKEVEKLKVGA